MARRKVQPAEPFFTYSWRGDQRDLTEKESGNVPLGNANLLALERKLIKHLKEVISGIFGYDELRVESIFVDGQGPTAVPHLVVYEEHLQISFRIKMAQRRDQLIKISHIPATEESEHIRVFFDVLQKVLNTYKNLIELKTKGWDGVEPITLEPDFIAQCEMWIYNLSRTLVIEYLFRLFNEHDEYYHRNTRLSEQPRRYSIDLVERIIDFSNELAQRKVENKDLQCGFIFHDRVDEVRMNSVRAVRLKKSVVFGDFKKLKSLIEATNGQDIFFNVTKGQITHIFITRNKVEEIQISPLGRGKAFSSRPLIVSVQGTGKVHFVEGRRGGGNKVLLQMNYGRPAIRDAQFMLDKLIGSISSFTVLRGNKVKLFAKWIMSLGLRKHGASLLFQASSTVEPQGFIKSIDIDFGDHLFLNSTSQKHDLSLLNYLSNPDGALVFNKKLKPTRFGTILPMHNLTEMPGGGARHNSVKNYTRQHSCLGIVVSEDGPITIFNEGMQVISF